MEVILLSLLLIVSVFLIYQDITQRKVHLILILIQVVTLFSYSYLLIGEQVFQLVFVNSLYFLSILVATFLYFKFRYKKINFFKTYFGIGDALFIFSTTTFFNPNNFILYLIISSAIGILLKLFLKTGATIPFIVSLSLVLDVFLLFEKMQVFNPFYSLVV